MKYKIILFTIFILFAACEQNKNIVSNETTNKLSQFKAKEKFIKESEIYYKGIDDLIVRSILTEKINSAADDFIVLSQNQNVTERDYQDKIEIGLRRFSDNYENLDTEERERICQYFEELMDIAGIESSGGHLNNFMYGFDPTKK